MSEEKNKYKMFRNYMCNELGITKQDIETWTKEAVAVEVNKILNHFDAQEFAKMKITQIAKDALGDDSWRADNEKLREAVAKQLAPQIKISLTDKNPIKY